MVRGRKPKPTATKEASGAYRKNPSRRNAAEPVVPDGTPPMPEWIAFDELALVCWYNTCETLASMKLLKVTDAMPIAAYCSDYAQWMTLRAMVAGGQVGEITQSGTATKVEAREVHKYQERMMKFWAEYGFTPSSRSRLIVTQSEEVSPMEELLARLKRA